MNKIFHSVCGSTSAWIAYSITFRLIETLTNSIGGIQNSWLRLNHKYCEMAYCNNNMKVQFSPVVNTIILKKYHKHRRR